MCFFTEIAELSKLAYRLILFAQLTESQTLAENFFILLFALAASLRWAKYDE